MGTKIMRGVQMCLLLVAFFAVGCFCDDFTSTHGESYMHDWLGFRKQWFSFSMHGLMGIFWDLLYAIPRFLMLPWTLTSRFAGRGWSGNYKRNFYGAKTNEIEYTSYGTTLGGRCMNGSGSAMDYVYATVGSVATVALWVVTFGYGYRYYQMNYGDGTDPEENGDGILAKVGIKVQSRDREDDDEGSMFWLWVGLAVLALVGSAAAGGYYYFYVYKKRGSRNRKALGIQNRDLEAGRPGGRSGRMPEDGDPEMADQVGMGDHDEEEP